MTKVKKTTKAKKPQTAEDRLRESTAPTPATSKELKEYIDGLVGMEHDYGTCVYAMSLAAVAAFNYVATKLGVTGFQASCADLDILARTRRMKNGFCVVDYRDLLYPQCNPLPKVIDNLRRALENTGPRSLREEATAKLADADDMHPEVRAHMERVAAGTLEVGK